jgi:hypothetical protein
MAGVKGRSGRKSKLLRTKLAELVDDAWPVKKRHEIIASLHNSAINDGDTEAAKTLLAYAYGRPAQRHEISGPDGDSLQIEIQDVSDQLRAKLANLARARGVK